MCKLPLDGGLRTVQSQLVQIASSIGEKLGSFKVQLDTFGLKSQTNFKFNQSFFAERSYINKNEFIFLLQKHKSCFIKYRAKEIFSYC